jgi:hypothetical protein
LAILAGVLAMGLTAASAGANTYRATRHDDPPPGKCKPANCSVREAIRAANQHAGVDQVLLPDSHAEYRLSRPNTTGSDEDQNKRGDLDVLDQVTIRHPGGGMATIDARGVDRVLDVLPGGGTKLVRIKLTGGNNVLNDPPVAHAQARRQGPVEAGDGGGIFALAGVKLVRSAIVANRGADGGGGIESGGRLTLIRSLVSRNKTVQGVGGGVDAFGKPVVIVRSKITLNHSANAGGGVTVSDNTLRLSKSTVANNVAEQGATGVYLYQAQGRISQSTISGNIARNNSGGGISQTASKLTVVNSTVTGNRADTDGGGIESTIAGGQVTLNSVTVARNVANVANGSSVGGGLFAEGGTVKVVNSIIALNRAAANPNDCDGTFDSQGGNLVGNVGGCTGFGGTDVLGQNPKLGTLAGNGGLTKTLALKQGSPAIGKARKASAPRTDQRGRKRDAHPDIGAFERLP